MDRYPYNSTLYYLRLRVHLRTFRHIVYTPRFRLSKIKVVLDMSPPSNINEVQRLTGRIAALNRFISMASDKCQPFFQVLKKSFSWDAHCEEAFSAIEDLSELSPHYSKPLRRRTPYSIPGSFRFLDQRRPYQ